MGKYNNLAKVFLVIVTLGAPLSNVQAVGGICSGGACGALAVKGSDSARAHSLEKYKNTIAKLEKNSPPNRDELAEKAKQEHFKVVTEWVTKKKPQLTPGTFHHEVAVEREMDSDMQDEAPEVFSRISHEL